MGWRETAKEWARANRRIVVAAGVALAVLFLLFGTKLFLYVNFLMGNDVIIKLSADKEHISIVHGEEQNVTFSASVTTNPFCRAVCASRFDDLSSGTAVDIDAFTLKPTQPVAHTYTINASRPGEGQDLYRFTMQCQSVRTAFCNTAESPTKRSVLVTVAYGLNEEEKQLKELLGQELALLASNLSHAQRRLTIAAMLEERVRNVTGTGTDLAAAAASVERALEALQDTRAAWDAQQYLTIQVPEPDLGPLAAAEAEVLALAEEHNALLADLNESAARLSALSALPITRPDHAEMIEQAVLGHNTAVELMRSAAAQSSKRRAVNSSLAATRALDGALRQEQGAEAMNRTIRADVAEDMLCIIAGVCLPHPTMAERGAEESFNLTQACARAERLHETVMAFNVTAAEPGLKENLTAALMNLERNLTESYLLDLPNGSRIASLLEAGPPVPVSLPENASLLPVFAPPPRCVFINVSTPIAAVPGVPLVPDHSVAAPPQIEFPEAAPRCCLHGECTACCAGESCRRYPVVFLHGHAFNKDISAEYSLDAFNAVQEELEEDGYINAGAISLYTQRDTPPGAWGLPGAPITVKASYYFDLFQEPENYVVVQTNSESIDTYAVRLKELVDTVQYKTGSPKVVIIAHSMGGLVARRYIQVFGPGDVDRLVMVGTPNAGIVGDIADYCPLVGERLECRDMNAGSLFLNKLNREPLPPIPITMIVGSGCAMEEGDGDGIVLAQKAHLPGARNVYINGTCQGTSLLHSHMLDLGQHPETYRIILEAIQGPVGARNE